LIKLKSTIVGAIALTAFGATYLLLSTSQDSLPARPLAQVQPRLDTDQVLVARDNLPVATVINDSVASWQEWPKAAVSEPMITRSANEDGLGDVSGSMSRVSFIRGEPIRRDKLVKLGGGGFMSAILPTGMRAVAIKIDNGGDSSAGGFILPNDRVDVVRLVRDDEATKARGAEVINAQTILVNVRVLAIGQNVEEQNGKKVETGANATLELDPDQVNLIILAQHSGNTNLHLVLRSLADSSGPPQTVGESSDGSKGGLTIVRFGASQQAAP
jgi:pilus assembly protein CpaB